MISNPPDPPAGMILEPKMASRGLLDRIATTTIDSTLIAEHHILALVPYGRFLDETSDLVACWCTWNQGKISVSFGRFICTTDFDALLPLNMLLQEIPGDASTLTNGAQKSLIENPASGSEVLGVAARDLAQRWRNGAPRKTTRRLIDHIQGLTGDELAPTFDIIRRSLDLDKIDAKARAMIIDSLLELSEQLMKGP